MFTLRWHDANVTGVHLLEECISSDLIITNKLLSFIAFYLSPGQSLDDFGTFSDNFEMTLDLVLRKNSPFLVVLSDFNAKLGKCYLNLRVQKITFFICNLYTIEKKNFVKKDKYIDHSTSLNILLFLKNFMAPFYGWGSTASKLEPLQGGSLLFTTKFSEILGAHFINIRRMKQGHIQVCFDSVQPLWAPKKNYPSPNK